MAAIRKGWQDPKPGEAVRLIRDEWIVLHAGYIPEEREQMIQFLIYKREGHYSGRRNCGREVVSDGPYDRCAACGSLHGDPQPKPEQQAEQQ